MKTARLHLFGPGMRGRRVSAALLQDVFSALLEGAKRAVRLQLEGRSVAPGHSPSWLDAAASFDLVNVEEGSTVLRLESPSLIEAVPEQFRQVQMFTSLDPKSTSLDLLGDALDDAMGARDSESYDDGLLDALLKLQKLSAHGVTKVDFVARKKLTFDEDRIKQLAVLKKSIAADQRVILAGKLDAIRHSDRMFTLDVEGTGGVRGVFTDAISAGEIQTLWGKAIRVSGLVKFKPSGAVQRIEADAIEAASDADIAMWSSMPRPISHGLDVRNLRKPQGPRSGVAAVFGQWPGEETDEEVQRALSELS